MAEPTRRAVLLAAAATALGGAAPGDGTRAWDFTFVSIDEAPMPLAAYRGRVLLVVNTASFCGYTPQYQGLEALHRRLTPAGLTVIGVPSQDFGQESDSNGKVKAFCQATFDVQFPMAGIAHVRGPEALPFYRWVKASRGWQPEWNFNKVLIGRDGMIAGVFGATDEPTGKLMTGAIDAQIARTPGA